MNAYLLILPKNTVYKHMFGDFPAKTYRACTVHKYGSGQPYVQDRIFGDFPAIKYRACTVRMYGSGQPFTLASWSVKHYAKCRVRREATRMRLCQLSSSQRWTHTHTHTRTHTNTHTRTHTRTHIHAHKHTHTHTHTHTHAHTHICTHAMRA